MQLNQRNTINRVGKSLAKPLSLIVANPLTQDFSRLIEAYWCILLGKGAGTDWAIDAEINAARFAIHTKTPVIFDIGANKGHWSLMLHQLFPEARIFMFEPQPGCQQIIREKNIPNATLIPCAVSEQRESAQFYASQGTTAIASLHQRRDSYFQHNEFVCVEVETVTVDDMVQEYNLKQIDLLKMDIEGHEFAALKGAKQSLEQGIIKALTFEFGSGNINSRTFFHDFWDLLHPLGYKLYRILPSSRLLPITSYYEDCEYFRGATNYLAVLQ